MKTGNELLTVRRTSQGRILDYKSAARYCYLPPVCIAATLQQVDTARQLQGVFLAIHLDICTFITDLDEQAILQGPRFWAALPMA